MADLKEALARDTEEKMRRFITEDLAMEDQFSRAFERKRLDCIASIRLIRSGDQNELKRVLDLAKKRLVQEAHKSEIDTTSLGRVLAATLIKKNCDEMREELLAMDESIFEDIPRYTAYVAKFLEWWRDTCKKSADDVRRQIDECVEGVVKQLVEIDAINEITHMMAALSTDSSEHERLVEKDHKARETLVKSVWELKHKQFEDVHS